MTLTHNSQTQETNNSQIQEEIKIHLVEMEEGLEDKTEEDLVEVAHFFDESLYLKFIYNQFLYNINEENYLNQINY
jgi:hypothetical protein